MPEETGTTAPAPTLDAEALRDVLGDEVDARMEAKGLTDERISKLDKLDLVDGIESVFEGLFEKHKTTPTGDGFDKDGFIKEIGTLIDSKLAGLTGGGNGNSNGNENSGKRVGPLGRFLSGSRS